MDVVDLKQKSRSSFLADSTAACMQCDRLSQQQLSF